MYPEPTSNPNREGVSEILPNKSLNKSPIFSKISEHSTIIPDKSPQHTLNPHESPQNVTISEHSITIPSKLIPISPNNIEITPVQPIINTTK